MHRLTSRLLLLLALVGNLAPLALAAAARPLRACCLRQALHHCHSAAEPGALAFRSAGCCQRRLGSAVTTVRWAHAQPRTSISFALDVEASTSPCDVLLRDINVHRSQSARAPPVFSVA
jgi:hypothetical protein